MNVLDTILQSLSSTSPELANAIREARPAPKVKRESVKEDKCTVEPEQVGVNLFDKVYGVSLMQFREMITAHQWAIGQQSYCPPDGTSELHTIYLVAIDGVYIQDPGTNYGNRHDLRVGQQMFLELRDSFKKVGSWQRMVTREACTWYWEDATDNGFIYTTYAAHASNSLLSMRAEIADTLISTEYFHHSVEHKIPPPISAPVNKLNARIISYTVGPLGERTISKLVITPKMRSKSDTSKGPWSKKYPKSLRKSIK